MTTYTMALVALRRFVDKQLSKNRKRSPFEYLVLATMGVLVAAVLKYPNRAFLTRARPDLKTPNGYPLLGNMPQMLRDQANSLQSMNEGFKNLGNVYSLTIPLFGRVILVNTPEHFEHVLKTNFSNYIKGKIFSDNLQDILGRGIFVADQDEWRFHRKTASNIFTTKLYRQLVQGAFKDSGLDLISVLEKNRLAQRSVDLQELFLKLTLDAFGKLTFGLEFEALRCEGPNEFGDAFDYLTANVDGRMVNPFWFLTDRVTPGKVAKVQGSIAVLDKFAAMAVKKRRNETPEDQQRRPRDLLDHFINHVADDGSKLTDVELRDVFVNFMIAGRDTTAQGLTWQFYSLMTNPRVMKNLVQEIDTVLQGSQDYTYEMMMNELPYLKAVFHETLRLYPPVPKNVKTAVDDDVLPGGIRVHKGDIIGISTWCLGRNKEVWGEDAEQFVPERWLVPLDNSHTTTATPSNGALGRSPFGKFKAESPYKFPSFNAGPRLCLGQTFATLEALVTSTMLIQKYQFKLVPGQKPAIVKGSVTLPMANPLLTTVANRVHKTIA
ncbi:MAG: cytochrome P450 [Benniella sp.]|nr:MAG: cytochrome P450 [Benniella sp.]